MYTFEEMLIYVVLTFAYGSFWWLWRVGWPAWRRSERPLAASFFQFISVAILSAISIIMAITALKVSWPMWGLLAITIAVVTALFVLLEGAIYRLFPQGVGIPHKLPAFIIVFALLHFVIWMAFPEVWTKVWTQGANLALALEACLLVWIILLAWTEQWPGALRSLLSTILVGTAGFLLWKILVELFNYPRDITAWGLVAAALLAVVLWSPESGGPSVLLFRIVAGIMGLIKNILVLVILLGFVFFAVPMFLGYVPVPSDLSGASLEKLVHQTQEFWRSLIGGGNR
jgi:hypothetical protein